MKKTVTLSIVFLIASTLILHAQHPLSRMEQSENFYDIKAYYESLFSNFENKKEASINQKGETEEIWQDNAWMVFKLENTVIICGRRIDRLNNIAQKYPGMITRACDVSNDHERKLLTEWVIHEYPNLNILLNNAGVQYTFNLMQETDLKKLHEEIETNLTAPIHLSSLFANHLSTNKHAAIINISSGLAFVPLSFMPVYCATKAAIHSFTMSLRFQLKDTAVSVFEIIPPSVDTELGHDRRPDKSQTHGGIPVEEFLDEAMVAIRNDTFEYAVGASKNLREKNEQLFFVINK